MNADNIWIKKKNGLAVTNDCSHQTFERGRGEIKMANKETCAGVHKKKLCFEGVGSETTNAWLSAVTLNYLSGDALSMNTLRCLALLQKCCAHLLRFKSRDANVAPSPVLCRNCLLVCVLYGRAANSKHKEGIFRSRKACSEAGSKSQRTQTSSLSLVLEILLRKRIVSGESTTNQLLLCSEYRFNTENIKFTDWWMLLSTVLL